MKNIVEIAAWMYVAKTLFPYIAAAIFGLSLILPKIMDKVFAEDEYAGTKLKIRKIKVTK
jgi:hypothetical protein